MSQEKKSSAFFMLALLIVWYKLGANDLFLLALYLDDTDQFWIEGKS